MHPEFVNYRVFANFSPLKYSGSNKNYLQSWLFHYFNYPQPAHLVKCLIVKKYMYILFILNYSYYHSQSLPNFLLSITLSISFLKDCLDCSLFCNEASITFTTSEFMWSDELIKNLLYLNLLERITQSIIFRIMKTVPSQVLFLSNASLNKINC